MARNAPAFHVLLRRIVPILLVARVIAAPIALRPSAEPSQGNIVVRVCAWPVPRPVTALPRAIEAGKDDETAPLHWPPSARRSVLPYLGSDGPPGLHPYSRLALGRQRC